MCVALRSSLEGTSLSGGVCTAGEESAKPNVMVHVRAGQWHMAYTVSYLCSGAGVHRVEAVVRWREAEKCSGSCDGSIATRVVPYRRVGGEFHHGPWDVGRLVWRVSVFGWFPSNGYRSRGVHVPGIHPMYGP